MHLKWYRKLQPLRRTPFSLNIYLLNLSLSSLSLVLWHRWNLFLSFSSPVAVWRWIQYLIYASLYGLLSNLSIMSTVTKTTPLTIQDLTISGDVGPRNPNTGRDVMMCNKGHQPTASEPECIPPELWGLSPMFRCYWKMYLVDVLTLPANPLHPGTTSLQARTFTKKNSLKILSPWMQGLSQCKTVHWTLACLMWLNCSPMGLVQKHIQSK